MPLTDEIKQAAEALGQQLGANADVLEYIRIEEKAQQDLEVVALEAKYNQVYQNLFARQQNGEELERSELDEYYCLKRQIKDHPVIIARDDQLVRVKALFAQTAQHLTEALGIEYSTFAG